MAKRGGRSYMESVGRVSIDKATFVEFMEILTFHTVVFMLLPQPPYLGSSKVLELTLESANKILGTANQQPKIVELDDDDQPLVDVPHAKYWVILVYANWSVASRNFEAVLAQLSLKYDGKKVKFGKGHNEPKSI
jgi:hypothetical protein